MCASPSISFTRSFTILTNHLLPQDCAVLAAKFQPQAVPAKTPTILDNSQVSLLALHNLLQISKVLAQFLHFALVEYLRGRRCLLHVESRSNIDQNRFCGSELAWYVKRRRQGDEDRRACYCPPPQKQAVYC